jgi:hypothetical protein
MSNNVPLGIKDHTKEDGHDQQQIDQDKKNLVH